MRLIDADKFKVYLQEYLGYGHAISWVDAQPTAYDVEKVVAELEGRKKESLQLWKQYQLKDDFGKMFAFDESVKIVRKGGIE